MSNQTFDKFSSSISSTKKRGRYNPQFPPQLLTGNLEIFNGKGEKITSDEGPNKLRKATWCFAVKKQHCELVTETLKSGAPTTMDGIKVKLYIGPLKQANITFPYPHRLSAFTVIRDGSRNNCTRNKARRMIAAFFNIPEYNNPCCHILTTS